MPPRRSAAVSTSNTFLAMELNAPGFHHSVLADFRDRLAQGDRADRLLDLAPARRKDAGLVRERTTQRTDSTHVPAAVRDLTRLDLYQHGADRAFGPRLQVLRQIMVQNYYRDAAGRLRWRTDDGGIPPSSRAFTKGQCQPCPVRARCTTSRESARNVGFPPRELRDLQVRVRQEQQTPDWQARYAVRSGVEAHARNSRAAITVTAARLRRS